MQSVDVRQLSDQETLNEGEFPGSNKRDFRLYFSPDVYQGIQEHAAADTSVEICGVLVGEWKRDENGPFAVVGNYIRCEMATSKNAEVTFTHEAWSQINAEMDSKYDDQRIIGWYHSHPDFGIFLSERDMFIQQHFFSGPGQVAYVVDPVRKLEGVFVWRDGKAEPIADYWVGNEVKTVAALSGDGSERSRAARDGEQRPKYETAAAPPLPPLFDFRTVLAWIGLFLLGYFLAGTRSRWERQLIERQAIQDYGMYKVMKVGMGQEMDGARRHLRDSVAFYKQLSQIDQSELTKSEKRQYAKEKARLLKGFDDLDRHLALIRQKYALQAHEIRAFQEMQQRAAALGKAQAERKATADSQAAGKSAGTKSAETDSPSKD